jgi:large subunit ribosomal protein L24
MNIKKGDTVIVISGKDKGKSGKVVRSIPRDFRVVVEGINIAKRRERPKREGQKGQTLSVAMPIHVSNVSLLDAKSGKRTRVGKKIVDGKRVRVSKKSGAVI